MKGRRRRAVTPLGLAGTAVTVAALTLLARTRSPGPAGRRPAGGDEADADPGKRWVPLLLIPGA
ncbi:hypothetical protein [Streptomyces ficellus]|uniref:Uncharacterized protein n=1 Tax=Streptomyces ficellus TaxID=1977088 RepID=A0A6I6FEG5_9ACTN|nr:hypothetical protein [Streptomyces ficellus]QGV82060.1 hypothetical protein EIZ62_30220 [Streptomyces ficellus]